jgi:EAL domain-containing protein (putative c-di-GMP-specific phosphodiesterase class I)
LSKLREIGISTMIDDFGTGYSSMGYLHRFSVSGIKIDKTFILDLHNGKKGYEIVKTIVQMAHGMGIETIAEGIEDEAQYQILRQLKCDQGQGFYLSQPVDADSIAVLLEVQGMATS